MFKFLKKIFKKEEEISEEKVSADELDKWFDNKSKRILDELSSKIKAIKNKINEEIEKTKQNLEILKNAQLRNPKIPFRAKQLMEGNRDAYIKRVDIFLRQIELDKNYEELLDFCNNFDNKLTDFGKSTVKAYHVLQEFLANESGAIAGNIKNIGNLIKDVKGKIKDTDIDSIKNIKENIIEFRSMIKQRERNKEELERNKKEREELIKSGKDIINDIEVLKKDNEYEKLSKLRAEKDEIIRQINAHKSKLLHSFSVIETALKKFSRMAFENEKLVNRYLENPLFLSEDKELKIINILKALERNVLNNTVQLKDRKKRKTLEEIKKMDKEFFDNFLKRYNESKEKINQIDNDTNKIDIQNKINELNSKKENNDLKLENMGKDITNLKKNIEKEDIDKLKENIKKEINAKLKTNIIVS